MGRGGVVQDRAGEGERGGGAGRVAWNQAWSAWRESTSTPKANALHDQVGVGERMILKVDQIIQQTIKKITKQKSKDNKKEKEIRIKCGPKGDPRSPIRRPKEY